MGGGDEVALIVVERNGILLTPKHGNPPTPALVLW